MKRITVSLTEEEYNTLQESRGKDTPLSSHARNLILASLDAETPKNPVNNNQEVLSSLDEIKKILSEEKPQTSTDASQSIDPVDFNHALKRLKELPQLAKHQVMLDKFKNINKTLEDFVNAFEKYNSK